MNAESDLLRAVLENPFDDGPRLVYADWLDEHGEPERAEFIRASVNGGIGFDCHASPCCVVPFRGHEIGFNLGMVGRWVIDRGFPSEVRLTLAEFMGGECRHWVHALEPVSEVFPIGNFCPTCEGTGTTPGLAKEIFSRWPVTRVVLSDTVIHDSGGNDTCYIGGLGSFPQEYWRRLDNHKNYPAARRALSEVCVDYGRSLAGLPPIQWPDDRLTRLGVPDDLRADVSQIIDWSR